MYAEGQTLKITATENNIYVAPGTQFTVVVEADVIDNVVNVKFTAEDAETIPSLKVRRRDYMGILFQGGAGFYPQWIIEIVDAPITEMPALSPCETDMVYDQPQLVCHCGCEDDPDDDMLCPECGRARYMNADTLHELVFGRLPEHNGTAWDANERLSDKQNAQSVGNYFLGISQSK